MLNAILSDIHSNLEAFLSVIKDLEKRFPDNVICLGDLIGYGPDPEEIVQLFQEKSYLSVLGNHEAALADAKMRNWLNFQAKENSIQTERLLSQESLDFCCGLPKDLIFENALFVHGFPPDSVLSYVTMIPDKDIISYFEQSFQDLIFVGHTHDLLVISWDGSRLKRERLVGGKYRLQEGLKYIINAGSVGQPRDGDNCAKYLLWNTEYNSIEVVRVPYDFKATSRKIQERGFPDAYGQRLW